MPTTRRSATSTFDPARPIPDHRVNTATMVDILRHKFGLVTSAQGIRQLPVSRQIVNKTLFVDPREVIAVIEAKFAEAPVIASGVKWAGGASAAARPSPSPRPRAARRRF